ncbi:MAG: gamma-glutamyltransferase, partial [Acidimicrobiia bacterium]|nr:gamma-glutamyltransferase [Acidimicrobiia bacterium]
TSAARWYGRCSTRSIATFPTSADDVTSQHGYGSAVVTPHVLATQAGMEILAAGGSAADAMVAADAVLGVVAPETCGIGGDLFALVHQPDMGTPAVLNASGRAGAGVDPESLRAQGQESLPPFDPQTVTVPGCVDGWERLLARFGNLEMERILRPAIRLASHGFPASVELSTALAARASTLAQQEAAVGLFPHGRAPTPGTRLHRPGLLATLSEIAGGGSVAFYQGAAGAAIVEATGGIITSQDLGAVAGDWVEPISVDVFGLTGWTVPPNSQGYLTLAASSVFAQLEPPEDPEDIDSWHLAIEAYRAMAMDRDELVADSDSAPLPPVALVSPTRISARAAMVDRQRASSFAAPSPVPGGTAYLCAIDANGMGVSFIQSNFMGIGSGIGAGAGGFFLHNRGAGFNLRSDHPNCLAPGHRPLHTLSPSLWTRNGSLACLLGTRGGDYQPQLLLQMAVRLFHGGVEPGDAQSRPRWMIDQPPSENSRVAIEPHTPTEMEEGLVKRGHLVSRREATQHGWGPVSVISVNEDGLRTAAADPRVATATAAVA